MAHEVIVDLFKTRPALTADIFVAVLGFSLPALLAALRARGIVVTELARQRILGERDPDRLERWVERAVVAASLAEVFGDQS
ncbi:MAG: hypothetical protein ABI193_26120 [Minicystis sp.]